MAAVQRSIRHLRLATPSEAALRQVLPRLEDALRCASLPDGDGRVLLVRRLALGAFAGGATSQALARLIEQRVAQAGIECIAGGTPAAARAAAVAFPSVFEARCRLALRLARREACTEWYWPLAVPEFRPAAGTADNLRAIAQALAALPEAAVALPAWAARLVEAGAAGALAAAVATDLGEALLRQAGIAVPAAAEEAPAGQPIRPRWLRCLLRAARGAWMPAPGVARPEGPRPADGAVPSEHAPLPATAQPAVVARAAADLAVTAASPPVPAPRHPDEEGWVQAPAALPQVALAPSLPSALPARSGISRADPPPEAARRFPPRSPPWSAEPLTLPTAAGGLLFLLPLMQRLRLPACGEEADPAVTARLLAAALHRLRVPPDDPAWALAGFDKLSPNGAGSENFPPPARPEPVEGPSHSLTPLRHWLRRHGRIGLASLVLRPARLALTPTHADMHFRLDQTDIRVRRLGLDIDPGWLPWFGRVVTFHYHREP